MDVEKIRKRLGMTRTEFAHELGVSRMTIHNWESGKTQPSRMAQKLLEEIQKER